MAHPWADNCRAPKREATNLAVRVLGWRGVVSRFRNAICHALGIYRSERCSGAIAVSMLRRKMVMGARKNELGAKRKR